MTMKKSWLKEKKVTAAFAIVAFFSGFLFVDRGGISGNVVLGGNYPVSAVSIIGLLLILCSAILAAYTIRNR